MKTSMLLAVASLFFAAAIPGLAAASSPLSFPDTLGEMGNPVNDLAEVRVELEGAKFKLTVSYAADLGVVDMNYGAVFIDTDRDPDTPADPFRFGADCTIMYLAMEGYASGAVLVNGERIDLNQEETEIAATANGIIIKLPLALAGITPVGGLPNVRLFATSAHLPDDPRFDRAPDAGWWDTETELMVIPRPGKEQVDLVYDDPPGDATLPDLTRVEARVRNGNFEFWFTFAHGVEYGDLPAWAEMLNLIVRMDLDHRLWSGYRNDDEWPPSFGIERTLELSFGRLFTTPMASLEYVRPSTSANPFDALLPDLNSPGIGSQYTDSRLVVGRDDRFGTARNQIFVSFPLAFLGYDDGEMLLRVRASRVGSAEKAHNDEAPDVGMMDSRIGLSEAKRLKLLATCADEQPPDTLNVDLPPNDSTGHGLQGDEVLAIRGCALADGGLRLTFDLKSLEPSDLAFINVYLDTDGNTETGNRFRNGSGTEAIGVDCLLNFKIAATPTPSLIMANLTEFRAAPLGSGIHNVAPLVTPHTAATPQGDPPGYCVNLPAEILQSPPGATIRFFAIAAQQFYSYEPGETQGDDMDIGVGHPLGDSQPLEWVPNTGFISVLAPTPPSLSLISVVPNRGPAAGGTAVRVYGSAFPRNAKVWFGGTEVASADVHFVAPGELLILKTPPGAGTVDVKVKVGESWVTGTNAFTFGPAKVMPPAVTAVTPTTPGKLGGGDEITISGLNFTTDTRVKIGGKEATIVELVSTYVLQCKTPPGALGAADVTVTNVADGGTATLPAGYAYGSWPPEIWTLYPNFGPVEGGSAITVIGDGFLSGATVTLGGVALTNLTVVSDRMLRGINVARTAGLVDVVVSNLNTLSRTQVAAFAYGGADPGPLPPGPFSSTLPLNSSVTGGVLVASLVPGVRAGAAVLFGGYPGRVLDADPATALVQVLSPPHAAGLVPLELVNPDGRSATLPVTDHWSSFRYGAGAPTITSVNLHPATMSLNCPTTGGEVQILGGNFKAGAIVDFGGVPGRILDGGG